MKLVLVNSISDEEITLDAKFPIIIGRGPLFKCADKRVSRKHCQMQFTQDGNVHIVALHSNPCFFMKNGTPPIHHIVKNEDQILNDGDYFGLLPDSFWFKIVIKTDESNDNSTIISDNKKNDTFTSQKNEKIVNDCTNEVKNNENYKKTVEHPNVSTIQLAEETQSGIPENIKSDIINFTNSTLDKKLKALEKTQKLPLWMYEIDDIPKEIQQMEKKLFSSKSAKSSEEETVLKNENNCNDSVASIATAEEEKIVLKHKEDAPNEAKTENVGAPNEYIILKNSTMLDDSKTTSETSQEKTVQDDSCKKRNPNFPTSKRPICQYEEKCYRKNESHKLKFCHPGDADFIEYKDRPICEYGSSCYRRNEMHRIEYQHPKAGSSSKTHTKNHVEPSPPQKKQKRTMNYKSSEEDDYDLEDPFINDASSDDYIPSDITSEEETDDTHPSS